MTLQNKQLKPRLLTKFVQNDLFQMGFKGFLLLSLSSWKNFQRYALCIAGVAGTFQDTFGVWTRPVHWFVKTGDRPAPYPGETVVSHLRRLEWSAGLPGNPPTKETAKSAERKKNQGTPHPPRGRRPQRRNKSREMEALLGEVASCHAWLGVRVPSSIFYSSSFFYSLPQTN